MAFPFVVCVVLNTNHRVDTLECLKSLEQNTYRNQHVILLDNSSSDGSVEAVRAAFPAVQIIQLKENLGYAGNNDVGIVEAIKQGADWVFVLNEDTVLAPDCISSLILEGESNSKIGILGPLVYHHNEPEIIQSAGGKTNRYYEGWHIGQDEPDCGQFQRPLQVDWITGCGIMVRRAVIEQIGTIDARFFYYVEEFDWCMRAKEADWQIVNVPQAKMWHKGVQRNNQPKPSVTYYATRNRLLVLLKHNPGFGVWVVTWMQFFRTMTSWTLKPKWRNKKEHRDAMWHAMVDFVHRRWGKMQ